MGRAVGLAEQILGTYKNKMESVELATFSDGRFEVFADSQKIYSKHATGQFPEWEDIQAGIGKAS